MINKLVIFVEGQTEQLFVERLILEIAGARRVVVEKRQAFGGKRLQRRIRLVEAKAPVSDERWFALIVDCSADSRVKSDIVEQYASLAAKGYSGIIGIRDVYPAVLRADIQKLRDGLRYRVKTNPIEVLLVLAVMEIEAWFLSEHSHFGRLDAGLTLDIIRNNLHFDPSVYDMQLRDNPADDLDTIYRLVGKAYSKRRDRVARTVEALDFATIYLDVATRFPDLQALVDRVDQFLSE